jgi:hypothetical protein
MTLARSLQKIFCKDANDVTKFGTNLTTPVYTKNVETVQSDSAWANGLAAAADAAKRVFLSDMNALFYTITYQLAYFFQQGIPEYYEYEEYFIGSVVQSGGAIYISVRNNNITYPLTDASAWKLIGSPSDVGFMALKAKATAGEALRAATLWTSRTIADGPRSVCWSSELGLFCAVCTTGTYPIYTSPDGITWTGRSVVPNQWTSVCWSPELGLFCAVAQTGGNRILISSDGVTWTAASNTPPTKDWQDICWSPELGLFCAIAFSYDCMTSPDGNTWTSRTHLIAGRGVCWASELGLFVSVGYNAVQTSSDGITWTTRTPQQGDWQSVCWSPELRLLVAVGATGLAQTIMTSPDGIIWTARTPPAGNSWLTVRWSPELGLFCAVAQTGTGDRVMTSPDGVTWTTRTSAGDCSWRGLCWSAERGIFVKTAYSGTPKCATSRYVKQFWR